MTNDHNMSLLKRRRQEIPESCHQISRIPKALATWPTYKRLLNDNSGRIHNKKFPSMQGQSLRCTKDLERRSKMSIFITTLKSCVEPMSSAYTLTTQATTKRKRMTKVRMSELARFEQSTGKFSSIVQDPQEFSLDEKCLRRALKDA
jgi:hypothetical protein